MIASVARQAGRRSGYIAMMGIGAVLGIVRGFTLAGVLDAEDFGFYAAIVAIGLFLAPLIGFGKIEETRKRFPRLWVEGRSPEIMPIGDRLLHIMAQRAGTIVLVGVGAALIAGYPLWAVAVLAGGLVAFNQSGAAVFSSALRAGPDLTPMAAAALARGIASLVLAVAGALTFGLEGAMAGEALGGLLGLLVARTLFARMTRRIAGAADPALDSREPATEATSLAIEKRASRDGLRLLFGTLAMSVPIYLSRPIVGFAYGPQDLGTFAFLLLFAQSVLTAIGITDQMIGPALVRMQHSGGSFSRQARILFFYMAALGGLIVLGLGLAFWLLSEPFLSEFIAKYDVTPALMAPLVVFSLLQLTSSLDWMLTAHDREYAVLRAALFYVVLFGAGIAAVIGLGLPLTAFLWVITLAKAAQMAVQLVYVLQLGLNWGSGSGSSSL